MSYLHRKSLAHHLNKFLNASTRDVPRVSVVSQRKDDSTTNLDFKIGQKVFRTNILEIGSAGNDSRVTEEVVYYVPCYGSGGIRET